MDCSVDLKSKGNDCTVYRDKTGEILADGLFVLNTTRRAADSSELRYAAFGNRGIYLQDAHVLVQSTASTRDPSSRIMANRLKTFASMGGLAAIDCNAVNPTQNTATATECALSAFAARKPFYVRYYLQRPESFQYAGLAGTAEGVVYQMFYAPGETVWMGTPTETGKLMDGNHIFVMPCTEPIKLTKLEGGELTCNKPVSRLDLIPHSSKKSL
ncbi:MAG TPA: hypothetical protein VN982_03535 [Candidatus Dormibacteraeota bacterium]|nr:hypothetical protein [Candidatus Dormibacteraeota bacterium]